MRHFTSGLDRRKNGLSVTTPDRMQFVQLTENATFQADDGGFQFA
jgi:hypothetical protein